MAENQITSRSTTPITCEHVYNNGSNVCEVCEVKCRGEAPSLERREHNRREALEKVYYVTRSDTGPGCSLHCASHSPYNLGYAELLCPDIAHTTNSYHDIRGRASSAEVNDAAQAKVKSEDAGVFPAPFAFKPFELAEVFNSKTLEAVGGVRGLLAGLGTHQTHGIVTEPSVGINDPKAREFSERQSSSNFVGFQNRHRDEQKGTITEESREEGQPAFFASLDERRRVYGRNAFPSPSGTSLISLICAARKDKALICLSTATIALLSLSLVKDFDSSHVVNVNQLRVDWVEGIAIMVAVCIVALVGSLNDFQRERQYRAFNGNAEDLVVKVIRNGMEQPTSVKDVVVGDIISLEQGDIIPCDGVFLTGYDVKCDESIASGKSSVVKKISYDRCPMGCHNADDKEIMRSDYFMMSGSKVVEGLGRYVVIAVNTKKHDRRLLKALRNNAEDSLLQLKLNMFSELSAKLGTAGGCILFTALMIRFVVHVVKNNPPRTAEEKGIDFIRILVLSITLIVVAVPEGLPLAVAFAFASAPREKVSSRFLGSHEIMANASVVCADMASTLTEQKLSVATGSIGIHAKFTLDPNNAYDGQGITSLAEDEDGVVTVVRARLPQADDIAIDLVPPENPLSPRLCTMIDDAIRFTSNAIRDDDLQANKPVLWSGGTDTAILNFARILRLSEHGRMSDVVEVIQIFPPSDGRKGLGVAVRLSNGNYRIYVKAIGEVAEECVRHIVVRKEGHQTIGNSEEIVRAGIDTASATNIKRAIKSYSNHGLRTVVLCYRDIESWPPSELILMNADRVHFEDICRDLVLIGIMGIKVPVKVGVRDAVAKCRKAGVAIKMCSEDNPLTARAIALQSGIFTPVGAVMEGCDFRRLNDPQMYAILSRLQVLARCSAQDKRILVEKLTELGEVVVDATNEPFSRSNCLGPSAHANGTRTPKRPSDVVLLNGDLDSIVKVIAWARRPRNIVRKLLQFRLSAIIPAVVITFISSVATAPQDSFIFSAVQLLWISIIMEILAGALLTDLPLEDVLQRKPDKRDAPLFSVHMYLQVFMQSIYQIGASLTLCFGGLRILGLSSPTSNPAQAQQGDMVIRALVFNTFVFAQIFNYINCRRMDNKVNILEGFIHNPRSIVVLAVVVVLQVLIIYFGGPVLQVVRLPAREWAISLCLSFFRSEHLHLLPQSDVLPTTRRGLTRVVDAADDNLQMFSFLRGGRIQASSLVQRNRFRKVQIDFTPAIEIANGCAQPSHSSGSRRHRDGGCSGDGYTPMIYPPRSNIRHACEELRGCPCQLDSQSSPQNDPNSHNWRDPKVILGALGLVIGLIGAIASLVPLFS